MNLFREFRGTALAGLLIILSFFAVGVGWATSLPISGAVIALGMVKVESLRKKIQHLEGGIVRQIHIRAGDHVAVGALLLTLDDVHARTRVADLRNQLRTVAAIEARLRAERSGEERVGYHHKLLTQSSDSEVAAILQQEDSQFKTRRENEDSRKNLLSNRIVQIRKRIDGNQHQMTGVKSQIEILNGQIKRIRHLLKNGNARRTTLDELLREHAKQVAREGELLAEVASLQESIGETELRILNLKTDFMTKIDAEFTEVQSRRLRLEKAFHEAQDQLVRTKITSPVNGRVMNMQVKTAGGVINTGQLLMEVVPDNDTMIIKARIKPRDIDEVNLGNEAYIVFPSYPQRNLARLKSRLLQVSPDVFEDQQTREAYYEADLELDVTRLRELAPQIELKPGLPAEVYITTEARTLWNYLLQPVHQVLERTFRES